MFCYIYIETSRQNKLNSNINLPSNHNKIEIDIIFLPDSPSLQFAPCSVVIPTLLLFPESIRRLSMSFSMDFSFTTGALASSVLLVDDDSWLLGVDSFFHFILLFWNHVFTWVSFKPNVCASLARLDVSKYLCSANVFSKTRSWRSVNTVRDLRHLRPLGVRRVGLTRKYTGSWLKISGLGSVKSKSGELIQEKPRCLMLTKRLENCWHRIKKLPRFQELARYNKKQITDDR